MLLAAAMMTPAVVSAEGEWLYVGAQSSASETTFSFGGGGSPDATYSVRLYAGEACETIITPENLVAESTLTTDEWGEGYGEEVITPALSIGSFVSAELASASGEPALVTAECQSVTVEGLYPPGLGNIYLMEPNRLQLVLDYSLPDDALCSSALDAASVPDVADFNVTFDGVPASLTAVSIPDEGCQTDTVLLTLDPPAVSGVARIEYIPGSNPIQNQAGQPADGIEEHYATERAAAVLAAGESITTDGEGDGATQDDPIEVTLTTSSAAGGEVMITDRFGFGLAGPGPVRFIGAGSNLVAPAGSAAAPIEVEFVLHQSQLQLPSFPFEVPPEQVDMYRHGERILPCNSDIGAIADPEPCELTRSVEADGLHFTVRTAFVSDVSWLFGYQLAPSLFALQNNSLDSYNHAVLWFTEELDLSSLPAPEDFAVTIDGAPTAVTDVSLLISGMRGSPLLTDYLGFSEGVTFLQLTWTASATSSNFVEIYYTPGTEPVRDLEGTQMPATTVSVENLPSDIWSSVAFMDEGTGPDHLIFFVPGPVAEPLPAASDFAISVNGEPAFAPDSVHLRYPQLGFSLVDLTLPTPLNAWDQVYLTYAAGATPLALEDGTIIDSTEMDVAMSLSYQSPRQTEPNPDGGQVVINPPDSSSGATYATITFAEVTGGGITTFASDIETTAPPLPANFSVGDPAAYFEISTTATFTPPAEICIAYNPAAYSDENDVRLLHFENDAWVDVTSSLDTAANVVCGEVSSFSPFAIAEVAGEEGPDYDFTGFYAPVDNAPTLNTVNSGQTISVKFSLGDDYGLDIFAAGSPSSQRVACDTNAPTDAVETTASAGNSGLQYDATADRYAYNWKTNKAWKGTCRQLTLEFADGQTVTALFKFGK